MARYQSGDSNSEKALARVWKAQCFSWWMTTILHTFPDSLAYDQKLQDTDLTYLFSSEKALGPLVENYVALPF
ncbi:4-hydroxybenzoate 3-monooxygenase [Acidovorax sp.]|uniref:4-hydroxybenzoate 3-monooxygenase n=1 Tax=Acidovorax sp. TaxID=1872122 RepID=UPI0026091052|nr:4-hydroxybenzoate 3-monooxygenase [Acidovorax sp.]